MSHFFRIRHAFVHRDRKQHEISWKNWELSPKLPKLLRYFFQIQTNQNLIRYRKQFWLVATINSVNKQKPKFLIIDYWILCRCEKFIGRILFLLCGNFRVFMFVVGLATLLSVCLHVENFKTECKSWKKKKNEFEKNMEKLQISLYALDCI